MFHELITAVCDWVSQLAAFDPAGPTCGIALFLKHYGKQKRAKDKAREERRRTLAENAAQSAADSYEVRRRNAESDAAWDAAKASSGPEGASFIPSEVLYNDDPGKYAGMFEDELRRSQGYAKWMDFSPVFNDVDSNALGTMLDGLRTHAESFADQGIRQWQDHQRSRQDLYERTMAEREAERQRRWEAADDVYQADRVAREGDLAQNAVQRFAASLDPGVGTYTTDDGRTFDWRAGKHKSTANVSEKQAFVQYLLDRHGGDWEAVLSDPDFAAVASRDSGAANWLHGGGG